MTLDDLLVPDHPKNDIALPEPYDLGTDDDTIDYERPLSRERRQTFFRLLTMGTPRPRASLDKFYAQIERSRPSVPYDDDDEDAADLSVGDVFQRLAAPAAVEPDSDDAPTQGSGTPLDGLFDKPSSRIPITKDSFGPLQRSQGQSFSRLSRFGYNAPIADPFGDVMRNELRKLVRAS